MKKVFLSIAAVLMATTALQAQDAQKAAAEAAAALTAAEDVPEAVQKPKYWDVSSINSINFAQTSLWNWAAGGFNNYSLAASIDANANYAKDKTTWTNRLQLDYGFLYSADKPILQKHKDRIYFESRWGYETPIRHLSYSASFDFRTQFDNNYKYGTPTGFSGDEPSVQDWLDARKLMSGLFAPAYLNLGIGLTWKPKDWLTVSFSPVTADLVIVRDPLLRNTYGMELREEGLDTSVGDNFRPFRFGLGALLKAEGKWVINDTFSYDTQIVLFSNYLKNPQNFRVNWDNKIFWKLAKYFALTLSTNLIYDDTIKVKTLSDGTAVPAGQFKEYFEFGITYTIAPKKK